MTEKKRVTVEKLANDAVTITMWMSSLPYGKSIVVLNQDIAGLIKDLQAIQGDTNGLL